MKPRIGVFDSGIGGITVLTELRKKLPHCDYVYLGDTAHLPYGTKSPKQIQKLSAHCAKQLKKKKIQILVVACNTISSWALPAIQKIMGKVPVVGVVEPGVEAALAAWKELPKRSSSTPVLVLATRATVQSGAYSSLLTSHLFQTASQYKSKPSTCIKKYVKYTSIPPIKSRRICLN